MSLKRPYSSQVPHEPRKVCHLNLVLRNAAMERVEQQREQPELQLSTAAGVTLSASQARMEKQEQMMMMEVEVESAVEKPEKQ